MGVSVLGWKGCGGGSVSHVWGGYGIRLPEWGILGHFWRGVHGGLYTSMGGYGGVSPVPE